MSEDPLTEDDVRFTTVPETDRDTNYVTKFEHVERGTELFQPGRTIGRIDRPEGTYESVEVIEVEADDQIDALTDERV